MVCAHCGADWQPGRVSVQVSGLCRCTLMLMRYVLYTPPAGGSGPRRCSDGPANDGLTIGCGAPRTPDQRRQNRRPDDCTECRVNLDTEPDTHARQRSCQANSQTTPESVTRPAGDARSATGLFQTGTPFGRRYHIIRQLGVGGMGAVYQAWDAELGVAVALKVIRPERCRDPAAARELERRFKRELLLARQVTHKNVVRIHDLGEIDGIKYITMPFVEGETSRASSRERHAARSRGACNRAADRRRSRRRARGRRRPPRPEAREHHDRTTTDRGADHGLRHRALRHGPRRGAVAASSSARSSTWRRNRRGRSRSISARTSTPSADSVRHARRAAPASATAKAPLRT